MTQRMFLIQTNITWLEQAVSLLSQLSDRTYKNSPAGQGRHRVGGHLRHILEFYECFFDGIASGVIDYDARKRNVLVEESRSYAAQTALGVIHKLEWLRKANDAAAVFVRMEDALGADISDSLLASSVERELQMLSSHTIHHFALIAMTLSAHGEAVHEDFGMAPSTLRHLAGAATCAQ